MYLFFIPWRISIVSQCQNSIVKFVECSSRHHLLLRLERSIVSPTCFPKKANIKRQLKDCKILSCKIRKKRKQKKKTKQKTLPTNKMPLFSYNRRKSLHARRPFISNWSKPLSTIAGYIIIHCLFRFLLPFFHLNLNLLQLLLSFELNKCYAFFLVLVDFQNLCRSLTNSATNQYCWYIPVWIAWTTSTNRCNPQIPHVVFLFCRNYLANKTKIFIQEWKIKNTNVVDTIDRNAYGD